MVGGSVVLQRDSASGGNAGSFHVPAFVLARGGRSWYIYERVVFHLDPWKAFEKVINKAGFFFVVECNSTGFLTTPPLFRFYSSSCANSKENDIDGWWCARVGMGAF